MAETTIKPWAEVLAEHGGHTFRAAQMYFLTEGCIHPQIPLDHLREISDGAKQGSALEQATLRRIEELKMQGG